MRAGVANTAVGGLAAALTTVSIALGEIAKRQADVNDATADMNAALEASNGVFDDRARKVIENELLTGELGDAVQLLGINLDDMTAAALGDADAIDKVREATEAASPQGIDFGYVLRGTIGLLNDEEEAARLVRDTLKGYREELEQTARDQERLNITVVDGVNVTGQLEAEMRRFKTIIDDDFVRVFGDDVSEAATGMGELRKQTFRTNTEMDRLFGRVSDEQAIVDFLETMEETAQVMGEAAEGSKEFEQAERDRLFALEDLIEAHSVLDAAFAKELLPLIDMGTAEEFETKIIELLGLIGQIAPNIQAAIDAGSFGMGVIEAGNQPYVQSTITQDVGARDGLTVMGDLIVQPPVGAEEITVDKMITYSKRNGGVPVANLPGVRY